jgi:hypothetical protein
MTLFLCGIIFITKNDKKYKYTIVQNREVFYTDSINVDVNNCITFIGRNSGNNNIKAKICGQYTITEKQK